VRTALKGERTHKGGLGSWLVKRLACSLDDPTYNNNQADCSVTEVEIVVSVVVVLALTEEGSNEVEGDGEPCDAEPDTESVVHNDTVDEEALEAAVHEMEKPLLGGVGAVMPDHTASVS